MIALGVMLMANATFGKAKFGIRDFTLFLNRLREEEAPPPDPTSQLQSFVLKMGGRIRG